MWRTRAAGLSRKSPFLRRRSIPRPVPVSPLGVACWLDKNGPPIQNATFMCQIAPTPWTQ